MKMRDVVEFVRKLDPLEVAIFGVIGIVLAGVTFSVLSMDRKQAQRCELAWTLARNAQDSLQALEICAPKRSAPVYVIPMPMGQP